MPQYTSPSGMAQLKMMFPGLVLIAPAIMWNGTIAANMHAHIVVSFRLIALNLGEPQYCSGTCSRAYSSVNGVNNNDANEIADRINAAIPRAYRATQWAVEASATNATTTNPTNVTTAPTSSRLRTPGAHAPGLRSRPPRRARPPIRSSAWHAKPAP